MRLLLTHLLALLASQSFVVATPTEPTPAPAERPRKIYAHYMGCYLLATRGIATASLLKGEADFRPDGDKANVTSPIGGTWRNFPLTPPDYAPTLQQAADLEIRRALRVGLDGFAVDVLAGQKDALASIDALFAAAEAGKYPFEITFCLDNPAQNAEAIHHLVEKHGDSPNLARRDGKLLLLGYRQHRSGQRLHPEFTDADWRTPESIRAYGEALREWQTAAGRPIFVQFDLNGAIADQQNSLQGPSLDPAFSKAIAEEFARQGFGGLSGFFWGGKSYDLVAAAARHAGLDWGEPIWAQYQNLNWNTYRYKDGIDLLRERWDRAIANNASLIQIATWNDYTEATNIAPDIQTGYALGDFMSLMIHRWKEGSLPIADHDRVYMFYPPYPQGSRVYPFHENASDLTRSLEVVTYLTQPGTVTLPGRHATWEAPAGLSIKKLPPAPGPVIVELQRGRHKTLTLTAREPITDRPFRPQHSLVAFSTEDHRLWNEDFPNRPLPRGYYADDDDDGLPNWFEMYHAGRLGDFTATTGLDPSADPDQDGHSNLDEYLAQTNPRLAEAAPSAGTVWDLLGKTVDSASGFLPVRLSFNPIRDSAERDAWRFLASRQEGHWEMLTGLAFSPRRDTRATISYSRRTRNALASTDTANDSARIDFVWTRPNSQGATWSPLVVLSPQPGDRAALEWISSADGTYQIDLAVTWPNPSPDTASLRLLGPDSKTLWSTQYSTLHSDASTAVNVTLHRGQTLHLEATTPKAVGIEINRFKITLMPHTQIVPAK